MKWTGTRPLENRWPGRKRTGKREGGFGPGYDLVDDATPEPLAPDFQPSPDRPLVNPFGDALTANQVQRIARLVLAKTLDFADHADVLADDTDRAWLSDWIPGIVADVLLCAEDPAVLERWEADLDRLGR